MNRLKVIISILCAIIIFSCWFVFVNHLVPTSVSKLLNISGIRTYGYHGKVIYHHYWMDILGYTDGDELLIIPCTIIADIDDYDWTFEKTYLSSFRSEPFPNISNDIWNEEYNQYVSFLHGEDQYTILLSKVYCAIYRVHDRSIY